LLHNAIKVGPRGSAVVVSVKRGLRAGQPMIEARVRDQGPGIAPAERERVFERFYRGVPVDKAHSLAESSAPKSTRHTVRGTGLGLAIVRRVVDLHGGQVMVEDLGPDERGASLLVSVPSLEK
jgi:signal transduction histidine kinase